MSQNSGDADVVGIQVGSTLLSGWQDVRIVRGIEHCPSSFDIGLTELYPTKPTKIDIKPGDPCKVTIGGDVVLTGYVDRYNASIGPEKHEVRISGRGMCQDLVDCSAMFSAYQTQNSTLIALARKLAKPFGINVQAPDGDSGAIPQFNVILTETPYDIIERVARWANFLAYEDTDGSLIIGRLSDRKMASGFVQGQNVQGAEVSFTTDNRFTEMHAIYLSTDFLLDPPSDIDSPNSVIPYVPGAYATDTSFPARRDGQPRFRPLLIVSEQTQASNELARQRTQWDNARRIGQSQQVRLVCDSWRDGSGALWAPNASAVVDLPALKLGKTTWLISNLVFSRDENGTTAEVTLMPKAAFVPALDNLLPFDWQIAQDVNGGAESYGPAAR